MVRAMVIFLATQCVLSAMEEAVPASAIVGDVKARVLEAECRSKGTEALETKFDILIKTQDRTVALDGDYVGLADGRMRMRITFGSLATIIDIGISAVKSHVMFPRKMILFNGAAEEAPKCCRELGTIINEFGGTKLLFPEAWEKGATGRRLMRELSRDIVYVYKKVGDDIRVLKKVIMSNVVVDGTPQMVITKVCKYDDDERLVGMVTYDGYHKAQEGIVPSKVSIKFPEVEFSFLLKNTETNKVYKDDKFTFKPSESQTAAGVQELPLSKMSAIGLSKLLKE